MTPPMKIVPEKIFFPFLSIAKKKYVGQFYGLPLQLPVKSFTKSQGTESKTRTFCKFVNKTCMEIQKIIMSESFMKIFNNKSEVTKLFKDKITEHIKKLKGMCDSATLEALQELSLTKFYDKNKIYDNEKHPQLKVVEKRKQRNPGDNPSQERIPFVIMKNMNYSESNFQFGKVPDFYVFAEDPEYLKQQIILKKNVALNFQYYFNNQYIPAIQKQIVPFFFSESDYVKFSRDLFNGLVRPNQITRFFNSVSSLNETVSLSSSLDQQQSKQNKRENPDQQQSKQNRRETPDQQQSKQITKKMKKIK